MRKIALVLLVGTTLAFSACSSSGKGGKGSPDDNAYMGEGNIPAARPGMELADVNFDFDSSALSSQSEAVLQENSKWLRKNLQKKVIIEGHCDDRGTAEYNMALGQRRADSVKRYLTSLGIPENQLSTISYGEEVPLDPRNSEAAWAKNRRAHFGMSN